MLNKAYTLKDNFMTSNAYKCIELNAHALIVFLLTVQDHVKSNDCFLPWLLGSQCCEALFRAARSMSSIFSTTINFGMLGLLCRIHRLHIQLALQMDSSEEIHVSFPRLAKRKTQKLSFDVAEITNEKIFDAVQKGQTRAKLVIEELGMAELFKKHELWGNKVSIVRIDGGFHEKIEENVEDDLNEDDSDTDEDNNGSDSTESQTGGYLSIDVSATDSVRYSEDLGSMVKHELIDNTLELRLSKQHKFSYKKLPSSTISLYQYVDDSNNGGSLHTTTCKAKFNPFIEVITSTNKNIMIRKTTALWLL